MASKSFTPGPWKVHNYDTHVWVISADGIKIVQTSWHSSIRKPYPLKSEAKANARLIAEAPNLYRELSVRDGDLFMLRRAVEEGDPKGELLIRIDDMIRETKAALAKVDGEKVSA